MSRIGNRKIEVPEGVTVKVENDIVTVTGPKGSLSQKMLKGISLEQEGNTITLTRVNDAAKAMHGTMNALLHNMILGVTKGYENGLEIIGVGYRFAVSGNTLTIQAGYSHPVKLEIPAGLTVNTISATEIEITGADKIVVGEFAANIRKVRQPEPYKGKGIRYKGEHVRHKEGKKASK